jgi:beta-amylase
MSKTSVALAAAGGFAVGALTAYKLQEYAKNKPAPEKKAPASKKKGRVPIFVMMPLDTVTGDGLEVSDLATRKAWLKGLADSGVTGVMCDIWWGLCEPSPGKYCFAGYLKLCEILQELGLKLQAVMSFHQCGGNVGDSVTFPIPAWAFGPAKEKGLLYKNGAGAVSSDCLSLSADREVIFPGPSGNRDAVTCYKDFMVAFASQFEKYLDNGTVVEIQVGMGPCGELRYPSYMMSEGWNYPGVGLICAHDAGMKRMLSNEKFGTMPKGEPTDQNGKPKDAPLFCGEAGEHGAFFLKWYRDVLLAHGDKILREACSVFPSKYKDLAFSVKVSGIHWHIMHPSRAAEACAGYAPCPEHPGGAYTAIAQMLGRVAKDTGRPVFFNFTCLEMTNGPSMPGDDSAPEDLIAEVRRACVVEGMPLCGENALQFGLPECPGALAQIGKQTRGWVPGHDKMHSVTLLRLDDGFARPSSLEALSSWISSL